MEERSFEEVMKEMAAVGAADPEEKPDLEDLVAAATEEEEKKKAEEALQLLQKQQEEARERRKNPHGFIRSTVAAMPDPEETSDERMEDYREALEASYRQVHTGDVMEGVVISVDETGATLDLNYFAPGKIPAEEMSADPHFSILSDVKVGERFSAVVLKKDDGGGNILLSRKQADATLSWDKLKKMMEEKTVIEGRITETVKAGAILYVEGIRGFIPCSRLSAEFVEDPSEYLNRTVQVQVIAVEEEERKLVLSARELLQKKAIEEKNRRISLLTPGNIVEGTVESIRDYGAFVQIGEGISGLLHISQISNTRVKKVSSVLKEGQKVRVLITRVDNGKVSLSMKALEDSLNTEKAEEDVAEYNDGQEATTSLGDLLKGLKF